MKACISQKAIDLIALRYVGQLQQVKTLSGHAHDLALARSVATVDTFADCAGMQWVNAETALRLHGEALKAKQS